MQRVLIALAIICYIIVLLLVSLGVVVLCSPIHTHFLGNQDLQPVDKTITKYLVKQDDSLLKDFRPEEQSHLKDVADLLNKGLFLLAGLIAILGFLVFNATNEEKHTILISPFAFLIIFFVPLLIMFLKFNTSFLGFHEIFFPQGNFLFPMNSILIITYPPQFFMTMGVIALEIFLLISSIKIFAYIGLRKSLNSYHNHYHNAIKEHKTRVVENNDILIRQAIEGEGRNIKKLLESCTMKIDSRKQVGLLEYAPPNISQIEIAIKEHQPIYVAIKNNIVIGTILCYNADFLKAYFPDEQIEKFLAKKFDRFHHIDALAVEDHYRKQGLGQSLLDRLVGDLSHHPEDSLLFAAILHKPRKLDIQLHFMRKNNFAHKGDLFLDDETAFGIYLKVLPFTKLEHTWSWIKSWFKKKNKEESIIKR